MDTYNEAEFIKDYVPGGKAKALLKNMQQMKEKHHLLQSIQKW